MIHRFLKIGRWSVNFLFSEEEYDIEQALTFLYDADAPLSVMRRAYRLMKMHRQDTGFTYANTNLLCAVVIVGPSSSGRQFLNTLVHEVHHLAVSIADSLGVDLEGEAPAYLSGDTAMALAEIICEMGCN